MPRHSCVMMGMLHHSFPNGGAVEPWKEPFPPPLALVNCQEENKPCTTNADIEMAVIRDSNMIYCYDPRIIFGKRNQNERKERTS